jgi:hypothetical protein
MIRQGVLTKYLQRVALNSPLKKTTLNIFVI